ncbi:MAG TPA: uroporphyrinogen-III C-methyltransferase [Steroidobacteraceae bacterium]|nr:uroporphyrinogen-III C-methyltransferase [Steroidobacteraceae bacterium]
MDQLPAPAAGEPARPVDTERRQAERRTEDRRKTERASVRALLAVLFAAVAVLFAALGWWQQSEVRRGLDAVRAEQQKLTDSSAQLRVQIGELTARSRSDEGRLNELGGLSQQVTELARTLEELRARTEAGERAWVVAEARYLMEIANRRLTLERDDASALAALLAADARLQSLRDPALNGVRRALAQEIQTLRATPHPDIAGIVARLASGEELAARLPVLGAIAEHYRPDEPTSGTTPGFARAWQIVKSSFVGMVSIRRIGEDAVELVSLEEQGLRRHHLQLLLYGARMAALRGDAADYRANVGAARRWLEEMFDLRDVSVASLQKDLQMLEQLNIAPALPDISRSLQLLDRVTPRLSGGS